MADIRLIPLDHVTIYNLPMWKPNRSSLRCVHFCFCGADVGQLTKCQLLLTDVCRREYERTFHHQYIYIFCDTGKQHTNVESMKECKISLNRQFCTNMLTFSKLIYNFITKYIKLCQIIMVLFITLQNKKIIPLLLLLKKVGCKNSNRGQRSSAKISRCLATWIRRC